jgi:aspartokinase/homoserine dehydrogenase 1
MISANSRKMAIASNAKGLPVDSIIEDLSDSDGVIDMDLEKITAELEADVNPHRVVIDMTNSDDVAEYYERWMSLGVDLISPSRKVAAGPLENYNRALDIQKRNCVNWQYETSVGSALPVLTTLKDLIETGDEVRKIRGSVSGTFAYVLSLLSEETTFSDAFGEAIEKGFTEKDFREDLSGLDVARKIVILARQIGMDVELDDVEVESFLPEELSTEDNLTMEDVKSLDAGMLEKFKAAKAEGRLLRYKFEIEKDTGKCRCFLTSVDNTDPIYRLKNIENLVAFETDRYTASPLIVKGAAAGPELAASGIFSDLLRCTRAYASERS